MLKIKSLKKKKNKIVRGMKSLKEGFPKPSEEILMTKTEIDDLKS